MAKKKKKRVPKKKKKKTSREHLGYCPKCQRHLSSKVPHLICAPPSEQEVEGMMDEEKLEAWRKLREYAADLGEQRIYASEKAIMFSRRICYCFVRPKKNFLEVCIFLPRKVKHPSLHESRPASKVRHANLFRLIHADQIEEPITDWIREAYEATAP